MNTINVFQGRKVRTHWDAEQEKWFFSVIDVIEILTNSSNSRDCWFKMKRRVKQKKLELDSLSKKSYLKQHQYIIINIKAGHTFRVINYL